MAAHETFSSRWGLIAAGLGMAVGTGNLWRFPRIVAQNGGGAFLLPWVLFLFIWSIPLLIAEFALGRGARRGVVGAFAKLLGERWAWLGGFIAVTTVMIMFYYSVVTGWTLRYFTAALTGGLAAAAPEAYWAAFLASRWQPVLFHVAAAGLGGWVVYHGIVRGVERANRIMMPILFALLVVAALRAVTLPGATRGLEFLFDPDLTRLASYRTWLEALTQSAWSTGAGWGLILTYAAYVRRDEDIVLASTTIGFGDNSASLLAALAVVPTAFALLSTDEALAVMAAGNTGLMFIWMPQLFAQIAGGPVFLALFFLALFLAALSSLIAMVELATRVLMDMGIARPRAVTFVTLTTIVGGLPSAVSQTVFENQDWVWGLGLMISGLFVALAAIRYGIQRFRETLVNGEASGEALRVGRAYDWVVQYLVPVEFVVMLSWWFYQAATVYDPGGWWQPLHPTSVATCLVQWGLVLILLRLFTGRLARASLRTPAGETP
jgi:NSS family neurotransmitter:Na+ symporter